MSMKRKLEVQQAQIDTLKQHVTKLTVDMVKLNSKVAVLASMDYEEPQLKQLDQSVFDGLDEKWRFAAVDSDGTRCDYETKPKLGVDQWHCVRGSFRRLVSKYNASNWQNSLIERDSKELTGSNLAVAYFKAGGKPHVCYVGDDGDENTNDLNVELVTRFCTIDGFISSRYDASANAILIDSNGNELTAKDVGL